VQASSTRRRQRRIKAGPPRGEHIFATRFPPGPPRSSGPQPSYDGEIPIYYGPDPGPVVMMQCPGDPTQGWTEYSDSFHVERPYTVPINTRFSIIDGIYTFWVSPNDPPHSPIAMGRNQRTEAAYGGTHDKLQERYLRLRRCSGVPRSPK
jgi:hypothetical protein